MNLKLFVLLFVLLQINDSNQAYGSMGGSGIQSGSMAKASGNQAKGDTAEKDELKTKTQINDDKAKKNDDDDKTKEDSKKDDDKKSKDHHYKRSRSKWVKKLKKPFANNTDDDCSDDPYPCGAGANCENKNGKVECSCPSGKVGNPSESCCQNMLRCG